MFRFKNTLKGTSIGILAILLLCTPVNASHRYSHTSFHTPKITYIWKSHNHHAHKIHHIHKKENNITFFWAHKIIHRIYNTKPKKKARRKALILYDSSHANDSYNHHDFLRLPNNDTLLPVNARVVRSVESQLDYWSLQDINRDRLANHLCKLRKSRQLTSLAHIRAEQSKVNFSHFDDNGTPYIVDDASRVGIKPTVADSQIGENLISAPLGYSIQDNDPTHYYSKNGHDLANEDENSMVNYDNDDGGHRRNILDNTSHNVGISSDYNSQDNNFYLAEEFE